MRVRSTPSCSEPAGESTSRPARLLPARRQRIELRENALESEMGGTSEILQGKVDGDKVSFVEVFKFEGNEIQITYSGQVTSDEITCTRQVAEFATEQVVAKRVK